MLASTCIGPYGHGMPPDKLGRECVSNEGSNRVAPLARREAIPARESLKQGCFAQRDRSIGTGVEESTLGGIDAPSRDGRGRLVPGHAPIDIFEAVGSPMARQLTGLS
jgi:hypothetical protein